MKGITTKKVLKNVTYILKNINYDLTCAEELPKCPWRNILQKIHTELDVRHAGTDEFLFNRSEDDGIESWYCVYKHFEKNKWMVLEKPELPFAPGIIHWWGGKTDIHHPIWLLRMLSFKMPKTFLFLKFWTSKTQYTARRRSAAAAEFASANCAKQDVPAFPICGISW